MNILLTGLGANLLALTVNCADGYRTQRLVCDAKDAAIDVWDALPHAYRPRLADWLVRHPSWRNLDLGRFDWRLATILGTTTLAALAALLPMASSRLPVKILDAAAIMVAAARILCHIKPDRKGGKPYWEFDDFYPPISRDDIDDPYQRRICLWHPLSNAVVGASLTVLTTTAILQAILDHPAMFTTPGLIRCRI